jgi:transposase
MLDLAVTSRIARDLSAEQFAAGARRSPRAEEPEAVAHRAPVRRSAVRVLRTLADRLEPTGRYAPQS